MERLQKEYYRGYYFWNKEVYDFPRLKSVYVFLNMINQKKRCDDIAIMREKFIRSGLREQAKDYQIVIQNDKFSMHDEDEIKDDK